MKRRLSSKELNDILHSATATESNPNPLPADDFWTAFRARAALMHQEQPETAEVKQPTSMGWRWAVPVAAGLLLIALVGFWGMMNDPNTAVTVADSADSGTNPQLCEVREVEMFVDYTSVMIMQDEEHGGTILLLSDLGSEPLG